MHAEEVARLVDRFGPEIYRYCHRLTGRTQQAEDLYQQTRDLLVYNRRKLAEIEVREQGIVPTI